MPILVYNISTKLIYFGTWCQDIACKVRCILKNMFTCIFHMKLLFWSFFPNKKNYDGFHP